jgi:extracellular elastinolytic metalloproteinase
MPGVPRARFALPLVLALAAAAPAHAARPFFDSRAAPRAAAAAVAPARAARAFGAGAQLQLDPLTHTPRQLLRLGGALSRPADGTARAIARRYVRAHAAALGLDTTDLGTLVLTGEEESGGLTVVRWAQRYRGIPAFDNGLAVAVDRGGRVVSLTGSPRHALRVASVTPALSAARARWIVRRDAGTTRSAARARARLVLFGGAGSVRLAWDVLFRAARTADYETLVDARTGAVLYRQNLVKGAEPALVYPNYPGAPGLVNAPRTVDLQALGYLPAGATTLSGRFAHTYIDADGNLRPNFGEGVGPGAGGSWVFPLATTDGTHSFENPAHGCSAVALCTWSPGTPSSWRTNARQNAVQLHWLVSNYHDHLAAAPIRFTNASGNFEVGGRHGSDPVSVNADEGAATGPGGGPDGTHVDNAFMDTRPDGTSPNMAMFLNAHSAGVPYRDTNNGDDAGTVYHEYTHGLSSRLITLPSGTGALASPEAGAMGEAWSDFYALDYLARQGLDPDDPAIPGQEDLGRYSDAVPHITRTQGLDCPVGARAPACPGAVRTGPGGYTYGDFGQIVGRPEIHADGEIWSETLWDIRTRFVAATGSDTAGSDLTERLVTDAMRLSPPEPSMLDERNAVLAADEADFGGRHATVLWDVFRARGLGYFAAAYGGEDAHPVESFAGPPRRGTRTGSLRGTVTDRGTGLPLPRATVGLGGHDTSASFAEYLAAVTSAAGRYVIGAIPTGTYPKESITAPGYDRVVITGVRVRGGGRIVRDARLTRDWAATTGGGRIASSTDTSQAAAGCGPLQLIDGFRGAGWETVNHGSSRPRPSATLLLPRRIDVSAFRVDPAATCGDGPSASTRGYRLETSVDGRTFRVASAGAFRAADEGRLNRLAPRDGTGRDTRYVRLTLLSPQRTCSACSGKNYVDLSELEVLGQPRNVLPHGRLRAAPRRTRAGRRVVLDASSFRDPDSLITGYAWDFDGDGRTDARTTRPRMHHVYRRAGTYRATVRVRDFRGGAGVGRVRVVVARG